MRKAKNIIALICIIFISLSRFCGVYAKDSKENMLKEIRLQIPNNIQKNIKKESNKIEVKRYKLTIDKDGNILEATDNNPVEDASTPIRSHTSTNTNTTPSTASYINVGNSYSQCLEEESETLWYFLYADPGKLTIHVNVPSNVDYDLLLYKHNESTGMLDSVGYSCYENGTISFEHTSCISDGGYYFIAVAGYAGFDTINPFTLSTTLSNTYDSNECDDSSFLVLPNPGLIDIDVTGTIDNVLDMDYIKYHYDPQNSRVIINLDNVPSNFAVDIYNANNVLVGQLDTSTSGWSNINGFTEGDYYFSIYSTDGQTGNYSLKLFANNTNVTISNLSFSAYPNTVIHPAYLGSESHIVDFGSGFRVTLNNYIVTNGTIVDSNSKPVPYYQISGKFVNERVPTPIIESVLTDEEGYLHLYISSPDVLGKRYTYADNKYGYLFKYYYDFAEISLYDENSTRLHLEDLYHFSHSEYADN